MKSFSPLAGAVATALLSTRALAQDSTPTCLSYGVDFQNGGSYFQNISSSDDFSFASIFEGCQNDTAHNILVDPNGDELQCSDTALQPDDTTETSKCPIMKSELWSGDWSVLIISNNGDADPIAYERDFSLSVGVASTAWYTPTVTVTITSTPVVNATVTSWWTETGTTTKTVTSPSVTKTPTLTITPKRVTTTRTKTMGTVKRTKWVVQPTLLVKTHTATCSVPKKQATPDPTCSITPTLMSAAALQTASSAKFRRLDRRVPLDRAQRIAERKARLAERSELEKRAPDAAVVTSTDTNTSNWPTSTLTSIGAKSTMTVTATPTTTSTVTVTTTTYKGKTTVKAVTITAATPTKTKTRYTVFTTTVATSTKVPTITITKTWAPASATPVCKAKGGRLV